MPASGLLLALLAGPAFALHSLQLPAPEFPVESAWLNAKPLTMTRLRGRRALLVVFLNAVNVNSIRALEPLNALHERYALEGLLIIGVHTPEFRFQNNPLALRKLLAERKAQFPVILDNERALWKGFGAEGWPAFFVVDHKGLIIHDQLGEGRYEELEHELRRALAEIPNTRAPAGDPSLVNPPSEDCGAATRELNLGASGTAAIDLDATEISDNLLIGVTRDGELARRGRWKITPEGFVLDQQNADLSAYVRVIYRGSGIYATLTPGAGKGRTRFLVRQDGLFLHSGNAGADILFDEDGRSYLETDGARLYHLARNPNDQPHELKLLPSRPGSIIHSFGFSDRCLPGP